MKCSAKRLILALLFLSLCTARLVSSQGNTPPRGRCTIQGRVMSQFGKEVISAKGLPVYLFTLSQSRGLQAIQRRARDRRNQLDAVGAEIGQTMAGYLGSAAELVPRLPRTAMVKTDSKGFYRFGSVPASRQYQVVATTTEEDGLIFVQSVTPIVGPGEVLHLDLHETDDNDWTELTPAPR